MNLKTKILTLSAVVGTLLLVARPSEAFLLPSSADLWNYENLTGAPSNSGVIGGSDIRNMFGGAFGSVEVGNTLFRDYQPAGTIHTVSWQTASDVTIKSIGFFAAHDGSPRDANARGISSFRLYAENLDDSNTEVLLFQLSPSNPYVNTPGNNSAAYNVLYYESNIAAPVRATTYRAEVVQYGTYFGNANGPRVLELDGYGSFLEGGNNPTVPEPATMTLFGTGLVGFMIRRKRS